MMEAINSRGDAVLHPERGPDNVAERRQYGELGIFSWASV